MLHTPLHPGSLQKRTAVLKHNGTVSKPNGMQKAGTEICFGGACPAETRSPLLHSETPVPTVPPACS